MIRSLDNLFITNPLKKDIRTTIKIPLYHVDAFTDHLFTGNPAAVCILPHWIAEDELHQIAQENNLPVTAFIIDKNDHYEIRWITPEEELTLCGHGALAAGFVIFNFLRPSTQQVTLKSSNHEFVLKREGDLITMQMPRATLTPYPIDDTLLKGLGIKPDEAFQSNLDRLLIVLNHEEELQHLKLNFEILKNLESRGLVITAPGKSQDFISRTFYPKKIIPEDPVTGSSHCLLVPYWAKRLEKNTLSAYQASTRGGFIKCILQEKYILLSSKARLYSQGHIDL